MQHDAESLAAPHAGCSSTVASNVPDQTVVPTIAGPAVSPTGLLNYVRPADVVLNLGSGSGAFCDAVARRSGPQGHVIGLECHDDLLTIARKNCALSSEKPGRAKIEFRRGRIHDLQLDLEQLETSLRAHPACTSNDWLQTEALTEQMRQSSPLIATDSMDLVLGEHVINLVEHPYRSRTFAEIYRVLKRGGRVVLSALVSDEDVPPTVQSDSKLWSKGISGAYREDRLLEELEKAGFYGIEIVERHSGDKVVHAGIEFDSVTVQAFKGKAGPCLERHQAVIYNGPWKAVIDDDGHTLYRGKRMAVCDKTFQIYSRAPYADAITPVPPVTEIPLAHAEPFDCRKNAVRDPRETKREKIATNSPSLLQISDECGTSGCC